MASKRAWSSYATTFCAWEMETLSSWIRAGQSGSVIGLPGTGKSNLLRFLCHRPDVVAQYLKDDSLKLAVVQVDLNSLPSSDLATLNRVILRSLYEAGEQFSAIEPALFSTIETLYRRVEEKTDPFLSQSALREVLFAIEKRLAHLVLVMDPFDQFCRVASTRVLDNVRALRDSFKYTLTYIIGLRHELAYLRDPVELGELYEIFDAHVCWMRPLTSEDAHFSISQAEEMTDKSFSPDQVARLIDLTGSYPALLLAATLWLAETSPIPDISTWEDCLLLESGIQSRLNDVWMALTGEEQAALSVLQMTLTRDASRECSESLRQVEAKYKSALASLQKKYLCYFDASGWRLFSPLFARFVAALEGICAGKIWRDHRTDCFFRGDTELADLSEQDRRLLRYFLDHPSAVCRLDDVIEAVWPDYSKEGVSSQAVQQAIRHLRQQIEPNPASPSYIITKHGVGYRFFPEGAPRG